MGQGLLRQRLLAVLMALTILVVGAPLVPAAAATDCAQMAMAMDMPMPMDMTSAPQKPAQKPGLPCNDGVNCLGAAGCAFPSVDQAPAAWLPRTAAADANWANRLAGPSVAYKPALPPPIA